MTAMKSGIRRTWEAAAARQNRGFFACTGTSTVSPQRDPLYRIPKGLDLRVSGAGFHNAPAELGFTSCGEAYVQVGTQTLPLGALGQQAVETGWIITGLRLRGALRFPQSDLVLMVPDREDLPYLLRVLVPASEALVQAPPSRVPLAA